MRLDLEGIVVKRKDSRYVGTRTRSWLKTRNPEHSQAKGRKERFDRRRGRTPAWASATWTLTTASVTPGWSLQATSCDPRPSQELL